MEGRPSRAPVVACEESARAMEGVRRAERHLVRGAETNRDLFGRVRGRCARCDACPGGYLKRANEYEGETGGRWSAESGERHPENDATLMNCSRCGCPSDAHEIDECADWRERGNDAFADGRYEDAAACFTAALEVNRGDAKSFSNRSACFMKMRKFSQALSDGERAVELEGNWAKARSRVGAANMALGRREAAKRAFELALKLDPTSETAREGLKTLNAPVVKSKDAERRERRERRERAPSAARAPTRARAVHTHTADIDAHVPRASIEEIKTILTRLEELLCDVRDTISQPSENNDADPVGANDEERNRRTVTTQTLMEEITATTTSMTTTTSSSRDASTNTTTHVEILSSDDDDIAESEEEEDENCLARRLRVDATASDDAKDEDEDAHLRELLEFFQDFENNDTLTDEEREGVHERDGDAAWAEKWEEEQFLRNGTADRIKPINVEKRKRTNEGKNVRAPGFKIDTLNDLLKPQTPPKAMGDVDSDGVTRGPCMKCDECSSFAKLSTWKRLPLPNVESRMDKASFDTLYNSLLLAADGERCARCGCESTTHATQKQLARILQRERIEKDKKENEANARRHRARMAAERVQEAIDRNESICEMTFDAIQGAERLGCTACAECSGFKLIFPQSEANNPEHMVHCSVCGCHYLEHVVCEKWAEEQEESRRTYERRAYEERTRRMERRDRETHDHVAHYKTLGVDTHASEREIAKAYRRAALEWHPDKHAHKSENERKVATKMFIRINEAFKAIGGGR